jgi:hypothetical protein
VAFDHKKDVVQPAPNITPPPLHDEAQHEPQHLETHEPGEARKLDPAALLPWFLEDGPSTHALPPAATTLAYNAPIQLNPNAPAKPIAPAIPLANPDDLQARADRMQAEKLLQSKRLETGEDASKAVDVLLEVDDKHRAKVIDDLDPKAFQNLLERVPEGEREKIEGLVDASQNPKRKLQMWAVVHKARAGNDLQKYKGDFGDPDDQTAEQERKQNAFERRSDGVASDAHEVDAEVARMMAKADKGQLTIAEIDAMRERKDLELKVETTYNINLIAQTTPRSDGSAVEWTKADLQQTDTALSQIPRDQLADPKMATTLIRRASIAFQTPRAQYRGSDHAIDVYDDAEEAENQARVVPPRSIKSDEFTKQHGTTIDPLEYTLTHEIGHNIADEHSDAYDKFRKVGHWEDNVSEKDISREGATDSDVATLEDIRRSADARLSIARGDKVFSTTNSPDKGVYSSVDATAIPDTPQMTYAARNSSEHFAEMYAQAVLSPETLYKQYVANPTLAADQARSTVKQQRELIAAMETNPGVSAQTVEDAKRKLAAEEADVKVKEKAQQQQGQEFGIMRNDVFGTDKAQSAAEARLHAAGASPEHIADFRERAAHASTPEQIETLEHDAKARR